MAIEDTLSEPDQAALRFCVRALKEDPDASYKEVRREARGAAGLTVRRQIWTLARKDLGLRPEEEPGPPSREFEDEGAPPADQRRGPPPRDDRRPQRDDRPPFRDPREFARPPRDEFPRSREDTGPEGERRRPAWATPVRGAPPPRQGDRSTGPGGRDQHEPPRGPGSPPPGWPDGPGDQRPGTVVSAPRGPVEFMVHYLQTMNREASFQEVKDAAEREGYTVYPATFGRAQAIVGIVEAPQVLQRSAAPPAAPAPPPVVRSLAAPPSSTPAAAPAGPSTEPAAAGARTPERPSGAIDPITGLMIFMTALDDLDKDCHRFRQSVGAMLSVVQQALAVDSQISPR